ncbi:hypothetical protein TCAL_05216 [Tigriopus californicus]|uniref:SCP domain-containing protein n=1 Tax=Tigriopus californicus TaxID=6832 RepID=A0A553NS12_TIGCA|nr:hypothetical protein TCAL_05216 [Tigriopus californicus]
MLSYSPALCLLSILIASFSPAQGSGSLSGFSTGSQTLSLPKDRNGNPDYCFITKAHTACNAKGYGAKCTRVLGDGVSKFEKAEIMRVHNEFRAKLANGLEKRGRPGPQPSAADMEEMEWDDELARVAQAHANECKFAHDCADCRRVERFGVGQNLYIYKQTQESAATDWTRAITDWYDEVKLFSKRSVKPFRCDRRHHQTNPTTNNNYYYDDDDYDDDDIHGVSSEIAGKDWLLTTVNDVFGNEIDQYYSVDLKSNEESEMFFEDMVPHPKQGIACLSFRYKKYLKDGGQSPLEVLAWPIAAALVNNFFVILFRATSPTAKKMYVALNDVAVEDGPCD